jgi:DNA-binding beta-propeller fold protein YncE
VRASLRRALAVLGALLLLAGLVGPARAGSATRTPTAGVLLPSGRLVTPAGSQWDSTRTAADHAYDLGDFPLGLALSPDGRLAVASLNGRGYGTPHTNGTFCDQHAGPHPVQCPGVPDRLKGDPRLTAPDEGLDVVDLRTGRTVQVVAVPTSNSADGHHTCGQGYNCFGMGVTFSPDGKHVYASGGGADAVYDFAVTGATLKLAHTTAIPSPSKRVPDYPIAGGAAGYPRGLKVTPDGTTLIVVDEFDSTIEALDVTGGKVPTLTAQALVPGGIPGALPVAYLYDVVISPDGTLAYVTAEGTGAVYVVHIAALKAAGPLDLAAPVLPAVAAPYPVLGINHPTGLALSPDGSTLLVTGTDSDTLAVVPLVAGIPSTGTTIPLSVIPRTTGTLGSSPDAVAVSKDGTTAYVALAGDSAVAVVDLASKAVKGYVPSGWYPTAVALGPKDGQLYTLAAKGVGSRYVPGIGGYVPQPGGSLPHGASVPTGVYYDAENMPGLLTRVTVPTGARLSAYTAKAQADIRHAAGLDHRPARSPIPAQVGGAGPISHVVYIVRENRTFDQVFGDLPLRRKDVTGDPKLQLLAAATPNAHAVANRYAISDSFYSDGEASVQGHWWTSSAMANDYIEKSWRHNYSPRGRPADEAIVPVSSAPGCSIFQRLTAFQLTHPTFTFQNFGELVGLVEPSSSVGSPTANLCHGGGQTTANSNSFSDPNYPGQQQLTPDDRTRTAEFLKASGLKADGSDAGNGNSLKNFQYLIMSEDHTTGLGGTNTPRSQVAQNDAAVGQLIAALSRSKYWSSTAVFVTEDDSQDGIDSVDGHRNVLLVASPYAKQRSGDGCLPGYVGHLHYDQASVLRTMELMLGVPPISAYDAGATPMYDLFQSKDSATQLTAADLRPFTVAKNPPFIDETVASLPKSSRHESLVAYSKRLDLTHLDRDEAGIEAVLWQSVRDDPLPAELSAKVAGLRGAADDVRAPVTSLLASGTRSTLTGEPVAAAQAVTCPRVVNASPVRPGQTSLPGAGLAATGGSWRLGLVGLGLLLLVAPRVRVPFISRRQDNRLA